MSTLVDAVRAEANALTAKEGPLKNALTDTATIITEWAEESTEHAKHYDKQVLQETFVAYEKMLQKVHEADAKYNHVQEVLRGFADQMPPDASPKDVYNAFIGAVRERSAEASAATEHSYEPLQKLRKIMKEAESGGAGPSGASGAAELDDDGFAMTQAERSTKCPLLQVEMTEKGDHRPMRAPCSHVFSFKGINDYLRGKRGGAACPVMGCQGSNITMARLVDDKEMVKLIRRNNADA